MSFSSAIKIQESLLNSPSCSIRVEGDNKFLDSIQNSSKKEEFSFKDLDSLQDASIDNELLENHFINKNQDLE